MSRPFRLVGSIIPFIFAALSFGFIIAAFVSRDWVHQDFFPHQQSVLSWRDPTYTLYRSPFVLCDITASEPDSNTTTYDLNCQRFSAYGAGKPACQLPTEVEEYSSVTGDWRMCQQVHFAGNLILASLVFICFGFALVLPLTAFFVRQSFAAANQDASASAETAAAASEDTTGGPKETHQLRDPIQRATTIRSPLVVAATYSLITFLAIAAMCAILSQFYGVLGLVQSQPDNGSWASLPLGEVQNQQTGDLSHAPWVQGDALTIYASLGWFFSALAAGGIGASWLGRL
ncbi:hypothetical protein P154DRAFT_522035 [Amniculicola lignicola CBS 123094]|uniref:Uncharacterized protein n=1 Tax=Amniculicola lignicola CBS 123094 TaxID=1392246 RepID=A0A6A5WHC0_9PLEO|nr:hypothetical protein P154DRAFT_522035 [Amniculicola lignicola CBS 123094]